MMVSFEEIERSRAQHGLSRKAVYQRAGLHKETWRRLDRGMTAPNTRTLAKLKTALDALIQEKDRHMDDLRPVGVLRSVDELHEAHRAELARTLRDRLVASYQHLMTTASPIAITASWRR